MNDLRKRAEYLLTQVALTPEAVDAMVAFAAERVSAERARCAKVCEAALADAQKDIARLREDAERYRWMRERRENTIMDIYNSISPAMISPELLDAAIDAAIKDKK